MEPKNWSKSIAGGFSLSANEPVTSHVRLSLRGLLYYVHQILDG